LGIIVYGGSVDNNIRIDGIFLFSTLETILCRCPLNRIL
jgi:hypothetical protein